MSSWRLHADGTIRPRFGFGAVDNSCVCETHHHHAYWRLDFDIGGTGDQVVGEHNDPPLPGRRWLAPAQARDPPQAQPGP